MLIDLANQQATIGTILSASTKLSFHEITPMQQVLRGFQQLGFPDARYYEVAYDAPAHDRLFVLRASVGTCPVPVGYTIEHKSSSFANLASPKPVIGDASQMSSDEAAMRWINDLGHVGKKWVDLPLVIDGHFMGIIACTLPDAVPSLGVDDLVVLELVSARIASHLLLAPNRAIEEARARIARIAQEEDDVLSLIDRASEQIRRAVSGTLLAVFEHHWESNSLRKIREKGDSSILDNLQEFEEAYSSGSSSLTFEAWRSEEYRHIARFKTLMETKQHLIASPSLNRHISVLGRVTSLLYAPVGTTEPRYFLRVLNRSDNSDLLFTDGHKTVFDALCRDLSNSIDSLITEKRLVRLQAVATGVVQKIQNLDEAMSLVREALRDEGIASFALLSHTEGGSYFSVEKYYGEVFAGWPPKSEARLWEADRLYAQAVLGTNASLVELKKESGSKGSEGLAAHLIQRGVSCVWCLPFKASRTMGVVLYPLPASSSSARPATRNKPARQQTQAEMAYAAVIGSYLEAMQSHLTAERARMLVGHIGHEVNTPILSLANQALVAAFTAVSFLPSDAVDKRAELENVMANLKHLMLNISKTMTLATLVGQEETGRLQLNFRRHSLLNILEEAKQSLKGEMHVKTAHGVKQWEIALGPSCERVAELVCDADLLKQVFINLFGNAMKYSLPRYPKKPMIVDVIGMRQTGMTIVQVTNWGLGIPPEDFERIFSAFTRGKVHDWMKAIPGMGLGLYISRRILAAHKGQIYCHHSTPTLDDPLRRERWEGYETTFEVRLPHLLKEGVIEHEFGQYSQ
ncbi:MAG: HAMP domain-containing sensor histidine kinase [Terriglobia bacterium]